ncbi:MAG: 5-methylthioadenosine phosphorylase [Blastocatellia bacterium]|jgi:5'-methylthioadenosine phosphorylase|nr:5-methylthioadenosine phosphorylase [Blastocatellia bacterium]
MTAAKIGIIGGSGLYQMPELKDIEEIDVQTPFGNPSDKFILGTLEGERVAFLPRHGRGHRFTPTEVPFRANIYGMKLLGVERILSASAVGSLQEKYAPLDMVIPDQFFDRTRARARESTFFGEGIVAHVAFAHPVCSQLGDTLEEACKGVEVKVHRGGTYLCMEGPAFSTVAESNVYRSWGMDVIGMTNLQEAKLAREAEICYATLALVTDYDCWQSEAIKHLNGVAANGVNAEVSAKTIVEVLRQNVGNAQLVMRGAVKMLADQPRTCECGSALKDAIMTDPSAWPEATARRLAAILSSRRYG